jgi:cell division protein FtsI/penicillin-binding protein 2
VTEGTATALAVPGIKVAGKTGTAEVGARKEFINSLVVGFFPYENPKYAFAVAMERAKAGTGVGAPAVMGDVLRYIVQERPEYGAVSE